MEGHNEQILDGTSSNPHVSHDASFSDTIPMAIQQGRTRTGQSIRSGGGSSDGHDLELRRKAEGF
jgi:hypothetical protein